jgi:hypothetical protein
MNQNPSVRRTRLALAALSIGLIVALGCESKPQVSGEGVRPPKLKRMENLAKKAQVKP